jgi:PTS system galactitol-specific IIC component
VAAIFAQAFTYLAAASRKFAKDSGREEIYVGVDDASGYGEAATLITGIVLIPITLLLAAVLPGNRVMPLVDLVSIPFWVQAFIACSNGNIFKSLIGASIWMAAGLYICTATAPIFTSVYNMIQATKTTGMVTSLIIMNKPFWGSFTLLTIDYGWVVIGILLAVYVAFTLWFKKNKVKVTDWIEKQAEVDIEE